MSRAELRGDGMTGHEITSAVRDGRLLRLRRDHYTLPTVDPDVAEAVRIGGRISCVTLLRKLGVFVWKTDGLHVHLSPQASRIRPRSSPTSTLHWRTWSESGCPRHAVPLSDAIVQAVRCQSPRAALATLDSLLHHRLVTMPQLEEIFSALPQRFRALLGLADGSAASGPETFMRLILRGLGVGYETQVRLPGVGYVDFVVDGWLIVECDSAEFHGGWEKQREDRYRDLAAARLGYVTVRPIAADILFRSDEVRRAIADVIAALAPRYAAVPRS